MSMATHPLRPGPPPPARSDAPPADPRRWWILAVIGLGQLMVVLDATIVNIALPSAQAGLGFSDAQRPWVVTAYAMAFGSLLLLGGRLADLFGHRRAFLTGLCGFALASALGGAAGGFGVLVTARALQGVFAALLAPAALALLTTTFTEPAERGRAFGVFGALAGSGGAVGLLLGGVLTEHLSWRSTLYVNLPLAAAGVAGGLLLLRHRPPGPRPVLDLRGAALASCGVFCLVEGLGRAGSGGWTAPRTLLLMAAGVLLLGAFAAWQRRAAHPLLPPRVVLDRVRGAALLSVFATGVGMFGVFLFLTYYLQEIRGYGPARTGLAFMPMSVSILLSALGSNRGVFTRLGARPRIPVGMLLAATGLAGMTHLEVDSPYLTRIVPPLVVMGLGMGLIMSASMNLGTAGIEPRDAGVGSAAVNTMRQVGGSVGTALMSTLAAGSAAAFLRGRPATGELAAEAAVAGYHTGYAVAAGIFVLGAAAVWWLLPAGLVMRPKGHGPGGPGRGPAGAGVASGPGRGRTASGAAGD
ncbi:DHA2 family efflux MFS transporter permease subunit [Streptomyces sp. NPDC101132]|uniref:DHA2 family efflux MFS transporter permease subunit n=1 Tax=Streptomyces sp. NPDC101132 TaxID=3366110 RepID=UPI00382E1DA3